MTAYFVSLYQVLTQQPHLLTLQAQQPHPQTQKPHPPPPPPLQALFKPQVRTTLLAIIIIRIFISAFSINTCTPPEAVLSLNTAGVAGVVSAVLVAMGLTYVCGLLTGLLVRRKKSSHTLSTSGDLATPTYEQVLPPDTEQAAISLKENMAYGHFNS